MHVLLHVLLHVFVYSTTNVLDAEEEMKQLTDSYCTYALNEKETVKCEVLTVRTVPQGPITAPRLFARKCDLRERKRADTADEENGMFMHISSKMNRKKIKNANKYMLPNVSC